MEMVLNAETFKFEFRVYDSMAAQGRSEVLLKFEVLNFCLLHQFGPEKQVEIPVTNDGENRTQKVYLISLRPRCPVIDPNFANSRPLVKSDGKLSHLQTWMQSPDIKLEGAETDYEHNLFIGCTTVKHRDQLTTKILRAGARYAFAVGFSEWGVEPYNYQNITSALKQCRKGDMIRLRGHYTVYNEQVVVSKGVSIVGDGECMLVNRQTQNQPSVVVLASADDIFFSNVGVRSSMDYSTKVVNAQGNFNKNQSGDGGYSMDVGHQDAKVFGNGAIEILYADNVEDPGPKKSHEKMHTTSFDDLEKSYADSLKPPARTDKVSKFDTVFPITTLILHAESLTCPGQISMHQDGDAEELHLLSADSSSVVADTQENKGFGGRVILHGVTVTDSQIGVYVHNRAEAKLRNCSISMCRDSGLIVAEGGKTDCHRCEISNNQQWGVAVYGEHRYEDGQIQPSEVRLFETMVQMNQSTGVACWDRGHVTMVHSTSCKNSGAGFDIIAKEIVWSAVYAEDGDERRDGNAQPESETIRWADFIHKFDSEPGSNSLLEPWQPKKKVSQTNVEETTSTVFHNPVSQALLKENNFYGNKANGIVVDYGASVTATRNYSCGNRGKQILVDQGCVFNHKVLADGGWRYSHAAQHRSDDQIDTMYPDPPHNGGNVSTYAPGSALLVNIHVTCSRSSDTIKGTVEDLTRFMNDACNIIMSKFNKMVHHENVNSVHPKFQCKHVHHLLGSVEEAVRSSEQVVQAVVEMDFLDLHHATEDRHLENEFSDEEDFHQFLFDITTKAIQAGLQKEVDLKYPSDVHQPFLLNKLEIVGARSLTRYRDAKESKKLRNECPTFAEFDANGTFDCLCAVAAPSEVRNRGADAKVGLDNPVFGYTASEPAHLQRTWSALN
eukprot:TRINITY_DN708_c0_g1_i6.p1 TRINITY_DN708_c0_g1~~TRINITY_DN708_c0_g1_i6.p1  ORF type:complete len:894 (+),score=148.32 TRINITY_DN708_c0_g1_i6:218-2899(+)